MTKLFENIKEHKKITVAIGGVVVVLLIAVVTISSGKDNKPAGQTGQATQEQSTAFKVVEYESGYTMQSTDMIDVYADSDDEALKKGMLTKGSEVEVVRKIKENWYEVKYMGETGYIKLDELETVPGSKEPATKLLDSYEPTKESYEDITLPEGVTETVINLENVSEETNSEILEQIEETTTEKPTEPPTTEAPTTQAPTEAQTETPTEAPTQPPTEAPTEAPTEPPTEAPTEASTEPPTEAPTKRPVTAADNCRLTDVEEREWSAMNASGGANVYISKGCYNRCMEITEQWIRGEISDAEAKSIAENDKAAKGLIDKSEYNVYLHRFEFMHLQKPGKGFTEQEYLRLRRESGCYVTNNKSFLHIYAYYDAPSDTSHLYVAMASAGDT